MKDMSIAVSVCLLGVVFSAAVVAQPVYRCKLADGSITFSDLPCESDIGEEDVVDATPHQGHRSTLEPGEPAYKMPEQSDGGDRRGPGGSDKRGRADTANPWKSNDLPRSRRLALEQERKALLSDLKRRHIGERTKRAMIRDLREADSRLGLGPGDVSEMPLHDRDVYEKHNVYPSKFEVIEYDPED